SVGITLIELPARIDLTIDGADEIDGALRAIKGAGGAMLREKVVAAASARMLVIADGSKRVAAIGAAKIPVE
ncbi:ribose-5-phosphate isomerase A, partial [Salmonella enterica]